MTYLCYTIYSTLCSRLKDVSVIVNKKKPLRLKNRSKYWNPDTSRTHVVFGSPESYQSRRIKIEGYETRLYWQYRYCQEHDGQTFFYTLTYNDKNIPRVYGHNCFDYEDLRELMIGGFQKQLLRKYGTKFKYFVGAELGDGKGSRGMHNNPHYHILFFLESADSDKFPYIKIEPKEFRHLVRLYWQGFDQDTDGFKSYNQAKFGIAKEGRNDGLVTNFGACVYCAKYVCKDAQLKMNESDVERRIRFQYKREYRYSKEFHNHFFRTKLFEMFNTPLDAKKSKWSFDDIGLIVELLPDVFDYLEPFRKARLDGKFELFSKADLVRTFSTVPDDYTPYVIQICTKYGCWQEYWKCFHDFIDEKVRLGINEYRNRHCNKCRISHGVGDYGLETIADVHETVVRGKVRKSYKLRDWENPLISVPSKSGIKNRPLSMYYYRKLFTNVVIDAKGSPIRYLNEDGIRYKVSRLSKQIEKMVDVSKCNLEHVVSDCNLYSRMRESDVNTSVYMSHSEFLRYLDKLKADEDVQNILTRYAEYKLVYEDRVFPFSSAGSCSGVVFPDVNLLEDYRRFLSPSVFAVSRSDVRLDVFLESDCEDYLPYSAHPYFLRYLGLFAVLDLCTDYFFVQGDNREQGEAEECARVKRFHTQQQLKQFYSQFR